MNPPQRRVSEIMQTEVATLAPDERLDLVDDVMNLGRVRHVPVVEDERVVGLLSHRDVMAASLTRVLDFEPEQRRTFMRSVQVNEVMARDVVTVDPEATLRQAAALLIERRIGCLPVADADGRLVGLVTVTDLLRAGFLWAEAGDDRVDLASEAAERFEEEVDALKRARDELRVQVHLGAAEARDLWEKLEKKWGELEGRARLVMKEAEEPLQEVNEAARELAKEIRDGYRRIRDAL